LAVAVPAWAGEQHAAEARPAAAARAGGASRPDGVSSAGAASRPDGVSPAARALRAPSGFLLLFRRLAGTPIQKPEGDKPPADNRTAESPAAGTGPRKKTENPEVAEARAGAKPGTEAGAAVAKAGGEAGAKPATEAGTKLGAKLGAKAGAKAGASPDAGEGQPAEAAAALLAPAGRRPRGAASADHAPAAVEARRESRPAEVRVFVVDLRRRATEAGNSPEARQVAEPAGRDTGSRSFERVLLAREAGAGVESPREAQAGLPRSPTSATSLSGSVLPGSLRERLLPEIVERAGIVLRERGEGEIHLVLKPEHLGSVRIRLHLGESSLEGRIVVDNSNVKELLDANMEQLKSALRQEGYASANIDVTVSGGGGERRGLDTGQGAAAGRPAEEFQRATPAAWDLGFTTVNLLA